MSLRLVPLTLKEANDLVALWHRHHKPVQGHRFSIGLWDTAAERYVGACIVGRPVARGCDHNFTAEVTRLVTDGTKNACSMLYSAAARACAAMGFERVQTYVLQEEPGTSLRAAGWEFDGLTAGGNWAHSERYAAQGRRQDQPMGPKQRWKKELKP